MNTEEPEVQTVMDTDWTAGQRACGEGDSHYIGYTSAISLAKLVANKTTSPSTMDMTIRQDTNAGD